MTEQTRVHRGQTYRMICEEPYRRHDGTMTTLIVWESPCAQCGDPFTIKVSAGSSTFNPNRRCNKHKRPGQTVRRKLA